MATLLHRPGRFQLALPLAERTCGEVVRAMGLVREAVGSVGMQPLFGAVLTDNGAEFADDAAIAGALGEWPGRTAPFHCDPGQSQQRGARERTTSRSASCCRRAAGCASTCSGPQAAHW